MSTIKTWAERAESLSDNTVVTSLHLAQFKQAEIDELRAENERLKAVPMKYKRMAFNAELQAENARLRDALALCLSSLQYAWGCIENSTEQEDAKIEIGLDAARAALGES